MGVGAMVGIPVEMEVVEMVVGVALGAFLVVCLLPTVSKNADIATKRVS